METILVSGAFLLSIFGQPVYASSIQEPPPTPIIETLEQQIDRVAIAHAIATTSLYNLAMSESSLGVQRVGDNGKSCGVVHFHSSYYPEEFARCDDDEYILNRAAEMIVGDEGWKFTPGNCYSFATVLVGKLPRMADIIPNTTIPRVGEIAVFDYKSGKHIAVQDEILADGFWVREANYEPYKLGRRFIKWDDPALVGFYSPDIAE
jgi:hypothetical protein